MYPGRAADVNPMPVIGTMPPAMGISYLGTWEALNLESIRWRPTEPPKFALIESGQPTVWERLVEWANRLLGVDL